MASQPSRPTVAEHFRNRSPVVRAIYDEIVEVCEKFGSVDQDPKKTSIHLANRRAFAGVATRKDSLLLTIKSSTDIFSPRIKKHERASANRWHLEVRLEKPSEVDEEMKEWLRKSFELSE